MFLRGRLTTIPDNTAVPDGTEGEVRLLSDNSLIHTLSTSGGWYEWTPNGHPGPFYISWNYTGILREQYSTITGPSGADSIGRLQYALRAFQDGFVEGVGDELAVTATGSSMAVTVGTGSAIVHGVLYDRLTSGTIAIPAAHATLPRIDSIIIRTRPDGYAECLVLQGTPKSGANYLVDAPALTQNETVWEIELARVQVNAAAAVIGSDKVFNYRKQATPWIRPGSIVSADIQDSSITSSDLIGGAVTTAKLADGAVTAPKLADNSVTGPKIAANLADLDDVISTTPAVGQILTWIDNAGVRYWAPQNPSVVGNPVDTRMPGTEYVATGGISSGTRTLVTMAIGPLESGVQYAVFVYHGVTLRNSGNTGTVAVRANINGGTQRTHEFQNVGGVPRWAPVVQTATVTGTGTTINCTGSVQYLSGDTTDVRAGWIQAIAIPLSILAEA